MDLLPTVDFLGHTVTRMIVGDNPQTGHSYIEDRISGAEMKEFYTQEKILETLFVIQDAGYNTIMPLSSPSNLEILKKFRKLGGKLNIIFQPYTPIPLAESLPMMLELEPIGIYHQGTKTDFYNETGEMERPVRRLLPQTDLRVTLHVGAPLKAAESFGPEGEPASVRLEPTPDGAVVTVPRLETYQALRAR